MSVGVLCLGEALVDLVCERHVDHVGQAHAFQPRLGGTAANVAVVAARGGARVALAGAAGDDDWGFWLRGLLERERIDTSLYPTVAGLRTPIALVTVDGAGEPHYAVYEQGSGSALRAVAEPLFEAVESSDALFIGSNTLVGTEERKVTMQTRRHALAAGVPVIFDANLRLHRWRSRADAAASANACVKGALLVRANHAEATLMTGEQDADRAARALVKAGARLVAVTLGRDGALLRGELRRDVRGVPINVISTMGAGDVFTGTLLARLAMSDFYPPVVAASLDDAVFASARACERWGSVE